ncbi:hypothetical protein LJR030_002940 [Rhizobium sp. LjRoot30]|uniref:general stress protein n=1 Tax=Rhizobium sp. LjRoot30 TaxID=3342320 RepID=UPI003ECC354C
MKTVTGLFDDYRDAQQAVNALEVRGVPSSDISIISNSSTEHEVGDTNAAEGAGTGAGIGAAVGGAGGLLTGLGIMAIPGVGPVVAAGWLAATAVGALAGAATGGAVGGLIGALTGSGVPEDRAHFYAEGVRRGGTLVTAKVDDVLEPEANEILKRTSWVDPDVRRRTYEQEGWSKFDDTLDPYDTAQIKAERLKHMR